MLEALKTSTLVSLCIPLTLVFLQSQSVNGRPPSPDKAAEALGFHVDIHTVVTSDGYSLKTFRYLGGRNETPNPNPAANKPTVLLWAGLGCNAEVWVVEQSDSFPNLLADAGFEVWLGNGRGSAYGNKHENYSYHSDQFWDFGWNENALIDIVDTVKFIRKTSGQDKIQYVGFSMGSTLFFVLHSLTSQYQDFFSHGYLTAPSAYEGYTSGILKMAKPFSPFIKAISSTFFHNRLPFRELKVSEISEALCRLNLDLCQVACGIILGKCDTIKERLPQIWHHFPDEASSRQGLHYLQHVGRPRTFHQYDYGRTKNKKIYGTSSPPPYNLSNILVPLSLYVGNTDAVSGVKDNQDLCLHLPNVKRLFVAPYKVFGHSDFVVGRNALPFHQTMIQHMKEDLSNPTAPAPSNVCGRLPSIN